MRQISSEVQRGFLADLGAVVSVILGSRPSAASCRPVSSPEGAQTGSGLGERAPAVVGVDFTFLALWFFRNPKSELR